MTHPNILRAEAEGVPEQKPQAQLRCSGCGDFARHLYVCNFCHRSFCFVCYSGAAAEVKGGLNVRNTSWNCCYKCAEIDEVQVVILQAVKMDAEAKLQNATKQHREKADALAAVIDGINRELREYQ